MNSRSSPSLRTRAAAAAVLGMMFGHQHAQAQETSPSGSTMDGIAWNCSGWHTVVSGDSCWSIEQEYGITSVEFLEWNPAVSGECGTNFWPDYSYCVRIGAPGPTMDGIASNCDAWHTVVSEDSCYDIEQEYGITANEFFEWNPAVSTDCGTNFWPDYSYCVGVNENYPTATSSSVSSTSTTSSSLASSSSSTSTSVNTTTAPYSTRYPITSYNLTAPYTATAMPPQHTLSGQPSYCNAWHQVAAGQTCEDVVNYYSNRLTLDQLIQYNPTIGEDCSGLYTGWYICVGIQSQNSTRVEWYTSQTNFTAPAPTEYPGYVATVVANYTASPQQTGIPSSCQNYYQAQDGDTCMSVLSVYNYVTEEQFFSWNPALDGNCQGLWLGYYYCVANYEDPSDLPMPPTVTAGASPSPTATGTISTCEKWYITRVNDDCASIAAWFGTFSEPDFISWNPSVGSACANIKQDTYYCVGVPGTATTRSEALTTTVPESLPTQTDVASDCTQFWLVSPSDSCASIIEDSGVANSTDFYSWNPAVGSDCAGLTVNYYVCVSTSEWDTIPPVSTVTISAGQTVVPSSGTTSSSRSTSTTTTSSGAPTTTTSTAVTTPSPYMPGMVDGCVRFYFRGSDAAALYCYDIASYAGIELSDFYAWNPQVGPDCSGLWADTWYCIGISGSTPTTISSGVPTPAEAT